MKMKRLIGLILCACFCLSLTAQETECPVHHEPLSPEQEEGSNGNTTCFGCETQTRKTLKLKFHIIRDQDGYLNFSPAEENLLHMIVNTANEKLGVNETPTHPGIPNQPTPPTNLRYELTEIVYYDQQNWAYPNIDYPTLDPDLLDVVMVEQEGEWYGNGCNDPNYCTGIYCCAGGWAPLGNPNGRAVLNRAFFRYVFETILGYCIEGANGDFDQAWANHYADVLIHEIGHMLDLRHPSGNDGCIDTPNIPNCSSNNYMDGCSCNKGSFTCCQIQTMHDKLDAGNYPFVVEGGSPCESDFLTIPYNDCDFILVNLSSSEEGPIVSNTWCIEDLQETGENAIQTYTTNNVIFSPSCNGDFRICLEIEDANGCISISCQDLTVDCTDCTCEPGPNPCEQHPIERGLEAPVQSLNWNVFPNPANTHLNIQLDSELGGDVTIQLFNMTGQMVKSSQQVAADTPLVWDVSSIQAGVYMLRAQLPNGNFIAKEIIIAR